MDALENGPRSWMNPALNFEDGEDVDDTEDTEDGTFTEEGLQALKASLQPWREYLHGRLALETAKLVGIFEDNTEPWKPSPQSTFCNAGQDDIDHLL